MNNAKKYQSMSFWQSESWKNILKTSGQAIRVEVVECSGPNILMEFRSIGLSLIGAFSLGVKMSQIDRRCFIQGVELARKYGALFWQIEYIDNDGSVPIEVNGMVPYKHFLEPYTRILDLTLATDTLLAQMHEKGRYNIRLAIKRGVTVEWVDATRSNIDIWMQLVEDTTTRDRFAHNSRTYYEAFLSHKGIIKFAFAYYEGRVIAAGIFVYTEDSAIYYYGASSSDVEIRKHMAPYLLQWFAIEEGKHRRCTRYDFLGIASPDSHDHHLAGVTTFKEKFGGTIEKLGPKVLYVISWKYWIFLLVRKMKILVRYTRQGARGLF